ncbi:MAG: ABC-F family ATP-binding cassette domain-containing protein [Candidatus Thermoplasmatota archaeon]|nr:ABC-F family ATP-binding cassette domain-containing protein [Candidatus Thermoplasmatota archaeon]
MLLQADGITRAFGPKEVINSVSLVIEPGDRIGLVGDNGAGKTTLFRLLMDELRRDSGELVLRTEKIGYLPQFPDFKETSTVHDVIGAPYGLLSKITGRIAEIEEIMAEGKDSVDWTVIGEEYSRLQEEYSSAGGHYLSSRALPAMEEVGLSEDIMNRKMSDLSGGERTKVMLARVLVQAQEVDLLFLDEPTSHLDIDTIEWLEEYLSNFTGGIMLISHDRYFLDSIATSIQELKDGKNRRFSGNYSGYVIARDTEHQILSREAERNRIERDRQKRVIEEQKRKWGYKTTFKTRKKLLDKTEITEGPEKIKKLNVDVKTAHRAGKNAIMASELSIDRGANTIIREGEFELDMGDKMGIFGPNGCGKSTLLKAVMGEIPHQGELWVAPGSKIGYFSQSHDGLDPDLTAEEQLLKDLGKENKALTRQVLSRFEIRGKDAEREISTLSGGERARVALAHLIAQRRNLLVLDEPTNYLDIRSKEAIEKALKQYKGSILMVTHDRYLLDNLCDKIGFIKDGILRTYTGNYSRVKGDRDLKALVEQAEAYRVVSKFTDWKTRTKYSAGDRIVIAFSETDKFQQAIDLGYLKRIRGNEKKKVTREQ